LWPGASSGGRAAAVLLRRAAACVRASQPGSSAVVSAVQQGSGRQIELCFRTQRGTFAFEVETSLPARGVTAIFGPSGCGKTTLLRCVAGLERLPGGRLVVAGEAWQDEGIFVPVHRRPLGFVFQEANLFPHLTVLENL